MCVCKCGKCVPQVYIFGIMSPTSKGETCLAARDEAFVLNENTEGSRFRDGQHGCVRTSTWSSKLSS